MRIGGTLLGALLLPVALELTAAEKLRFNRDIRPILSDKCFHCHGFDPKTRKAGLRLDIFDGAVADGGIVAGQAERSAVIERVLSHDPDEVMPPPESKLGRLSEREVATLRRWIDEGAEYEAHWSFVPLEKAQLDAWTHAAEAAGYATPIDWLVASGLKARGLKLQPPADEATLARRLSFDLTGLPPTEAEMTELAAGRIDLETLLDHKLASPAYGERMAADWLDIARYADSYGFQVDRPREVWMWRDWVIQAFNRNQPFDQFLTWQLAGDLLPGATDEQILATAFNRLHQQESEGGSVEEEYRIEYVVDRVQTVATAFLGLTFECARCHDHKYDPISQREFYGMTAFFQNIDEAGLYSFFTESPPTPTLMLMEEAAKKEMAALRERVRILEEQFAEAADAVLQEIPLHEGVPVDLEGQIAHYSFDQVLGNKLADSLHPEPPPVKKKAKGSLPPSPSALLKGENRLVPGRLGQAVQFTGDDPVNTPVGNFHRHDPFSVSLWLKTPDVKERAVVFHRSRAWTDAASRGYELLIEEGKLKWSLIHFWPGNAISVRAIDPLPIDEWVQVIVTNDGSSRAAGLKIFVNGRQAMVEIVRDHLTQDITGGGGDTLALGERFRDRGFKGGWIDDLRVFERDLSRPQRLDLAPLQAELQAVRAELTAFSGRQKEIMVMRELAEPKKAHVLTRGEYDKRGEEVTAMTPAVLPPLPPEAPRNRLGLARWLTDPGHPLTARVTVNRIWQSWFGRGLVKTSEDFGSQGEKPLYPELLDYLALRLIDSGWDVKALLREIAGSAVYRQRSFADAAVMADDPENQWLARGPAFRLPAEMIRDNALAAAGLLETKQGGPPVHPYELAEAFKPFSIAKSGADLYRRSLYTTWRRTSPPPALLAFDAPRRAVCAAKRERTDSPLQALILLNGVQFVEAARVLGARLHREHNGELDAMIRAGFLRCLSRLPDAREVEICRQLYAEQLAHYRDRPQEAEAFLQNGVAPPESGVPAVEVAAAGQLALALLNHDACVVKR